MKIVILDTVAINKEQEKRLKALGTLIIYDESAEDTQDVIARCKDVDIVISGWTTFDREVLEALDNTKMIALWSTGYDQIDLEVAKACGITVTNVRGYAKNAVAEMAVGLMLAVYRKIALSDHHVKHMGQYDWQPFLGRELTGKTIGILGYGAIGQKVAQIAKGFDMRVLVHTSSKASGSNGDLTYVSKERLLEESDIVSLHLPLTPLTDQYIGKEELNMMKREAILINTARGRLVDQEALVHALSTKQIFGAGLDDVEVSLESFQVLKGLDNVVLTPHIGFNTKEALLIKTDSCIDIIEAYLHGQAINVLA